MATDESARVDLPLTPELGLAEIAAAMGKEAPGGWVVGTERLDAGLLDAGDTPKKLTTGMSIFVTQGEWQGHTGELVDVNRDDLTGEVRWSVKIPQYGNLKLIPGPFLEPLNPEAYRKWTAPFDNGGYQIDSDGEVISKEDLIKIKLMNRPVRVIEAGPWLHRVGEVRSRSSSGKNWGVLFEGQSSLVWFDISALQLVESNKIGADLGPDAPTETNEHGASQSVVTFACTSLPPRALLAVAAIQKHGDDKYGVDNWRGISVDDHLNHALIHYFAWKAGDTQDKHLEHFATRVLMALEVELEGKL